MDLWVFGYGSLIWNPGFEVEERRIARLPGWHRSFCMSSIHHRGTEEAPGLVLALDEAPGEHCDGVAFRVAAARRDATIAYLRDRGVAADQLEAEGYGETQPVASNDTEDGRALNRRVELQILETRDL